MCGLKSAIMFHIKIVVSLFLCYSQRQWTPGYIYVVTFHTLLAYNYYGKRKEVSNSVTPPIQFADMFPVVDVAGYGVLFVTANPTLLFVHAHDIKFKNGRLGTNQGVLGAPSLCPGIVSYLQKPIYI